MNAVKDVFMYGMPPDASFDALMGGGGIGRPLMSDESYEEYWDDYTSWYERRPTGDNWDFTGIYRGGKKLQPFRLARVITLKAHRKHVSPHGAGGQTPFIYEWFD